VGQGAAGTVGGRVQTVAVRLIVEREREIGAFQPVEYWTLDAMLHPEKQADKSFKARFVGIDGEPARVSNGTDKDGKAQWISNALPARRRWTKR
jgi:DNA topoisomerase-1